MGGWHGCVCGRGESSRMNRNLSFIAPAAVQETRPNHALTTVRRPGMRQLALDIGLHPVPTLDNFFAGPNNQALAHLSLWVGNSHRSPVPTYLWGDEASGKSHLLKAVRVAIQEQMGSPVGVGWLDADMVDCPHYDERWRVVLLDDTHLYTPEQQQTAFNWFINAQTYHCWVLASGALPPADLKVREDLRTRLGWGHVFQLHVLSEAERRAVLRQEAAARGLGLSDEVVDFMLNRFSRNLGSLSQFLDHLDGYSLVEKRAITIPLIKSMLSTT